MAEHEIHANELKCVSKCVLERKRVDVYIIVGHELEETNDNQIHMRSIHLDFSNWIP